MCCCSASAKIGPSDVPEQRDPSTTCKELKKLALKTLICTLSSAAIGAIGGLIANTQYDIDPHTCVLRGAVGFGILGAYAGLFKTIFTPHFSKTTQRCIYKRYKRVPLTDKEKRNILIKELALSLLFNPLEYTGKFFTLGAVLQIAVDIFKGNSFLIENYCNFPLSFGIITGIASALFISLGQTCELNNNLSRNTRRFTDIQTAEQKV